MLAANMAVPAFLNHVETAKKNICIENRKVVEHAEDRYFFDKGEHSASLQELVDEGYMKKETGCPSGGVYAWVPSPGSDPLYQTQLGCSVHSIFTEEDTGTEPAFGETAGSFIDLLKKYFDENGSYPKGGWKKTAEALGLDPDDWESGIDGAVYRPKGDVLEIEPDKGYVFYIYDLSGEEQDPDKLIYSAEEDVWYYDKIKQGKEVDIDTLRIEEK